jgi:hypothetical protein
VISEIALLKLSHLRAHGFAPSLAHTSSRMRRCRRRFASYRAHALHFYDHGKVKITGPITRNDQKEYRQLESTFSVPLKDGASFTDTSMKENKI